MGKPCKYCGQSNTHKDQYGFCKKYRCFERSGRKAIVEKLQNEISNIKFDSSIPTYKRNQFDGIPYNPKQEKIDYLNKQIVEIINF
jgi:hypothetical protein